MAKKQASITFDPLTGYTVLGTGRGDFVDLSATLFDVTAFGAAGNDTILAGDGDDVIYGRRGNDTIDSGGGLADNLYGGAGNDTLSSSAHVATLDGGAGRDLLIGNGNNNWGYGGAGNDKYLFRGEFSFIEDQEGNNTISSVAVENYVFTGVGNDKITVTGNTNSIADGGGDNNITVIGNSDVTTTVFTGDGDDVIHLQTSGLSQVIDSGGNNTIYGGSGVDHIQVGLGNDRVDGGAGNDAITGTGGLDVLLGGDGNDSINGTGRLSGGSGQDVLVAAGANTEIAASLNDFVFNFHSGGKVIFDTVDGTVGVVTVNVTDSSFDFSQLSNVTAENIFDTPDGLLINNESDVNLLFKGAHVENGDVLAAIESGQIQLDGHSDWFV